MNVLERWALRAAWWLLWPEIRCRRRVTRARAAWHLLRHGSVIYGARIRGEAIGIDVPVGGHLRASCCIVEIVGRDD